MPIIQSLDRALRILDLFDEHTPELKITEISARMELHKSTVHSLLKTLMEHRYVDQDRETGKYRLGMKLVERGQLLLHNLDLQKMARPYLVSLSEQTGHTAHLVVPDGQEGVYVDKVEGPKAAIRYSRVGRRIPLHCSAVGKALLAFRSEAEIRGILSGYVYRVHTPHTIRSEEALLVELAKVRADGYALDNQENETGVCCVAAPVFEHTGQTAAAISISKLVSPAGDRDFRLIAGLLRAAAGSLSRQLGHTEQKEELL